MKYLIPIAIILSIFCASPASAGDIKIGFGVEVRPSGHWVTTYRQEYITEYKQEIRQYYVSPQIIGYDNGIPIYSQGYWKQYIVSVPYTTVRYVPVTVWIEHQPRFYGPRIYYRNR